jgi:hypothetical protein
VSRRARIRAAAAASVALVIGLLLASGVVPNTFSLWEAEATNAGSVYGGGWIPAPAGANATTVGGASNSTVTLSWTTAGVSAGEPNPNPVTGQQLQIADGGSGGSASCGTYGNEGSTLGATATSTTDSDGSGTVPVPDWWCYQVISTSASSWTSTPMTLPPARLLVPTSVQLSNGGSSGKIDSGDQIIITFNQNLASMSSVTVCFPGKSPNILFIGDSACHDNSDTYTIGEITGLSIGGGGQHWNSSSVVVSGTQMTVTIGSGGQTTAVTGTGTFTAGSGVQSPGGTYACTAASCTATTSGSF